MDIAETAQVKPTRPKSLGPKEYWLFILGPATFFAFIFGANESGTFSFQHKGFHFLYAFMTLLPRALLVEACSQGCAYVTRRFKWPLWPALVAGTVIASQLFAPYTILRNNLLEPYLTPGLSFFDTWPLRYTDPDYLLMAVFALVPSAVLWLVLNATLVNGFGYKRMGYGSIFGPPLSDERVNHLTADEPHGSDKPKGDILWSRVPAHLGRHLLALQAQEHYTQVYTDKGDALVLIRFSDAIAAAEADIPGLRIHRSHWIAESAIGSVKNEGSATSVILTNGREVPVSRSYRMQVRRIAQSS